MSVSKGGLKRKSKASSEIPSSSLADMAFLLLIFFMVSTTFKKEKTRTYEPPQAEATQKREEPRKDVLHVYVERDGGIYINDQLLQLDQVSNVVAPLYEENRSMIVQLRADREVPYATVDQLQKEFQQAGAIRMVFYTELEQRATRERR
ncbi:MAG TPA: biopolymer transporter ExbD [Longimicrobiales bacterium]|nr:biopolymer transporter ExbD [Longimicrobiales bacterium]